MDYEFSDEFDKKYHKLKNVRLKKAIDKTLDKFSKDPNYPKLKNHSLKRELEGLNCIHIIEYPTNDYCMVYKKMTEKDGSVYAFMINFDTHEVLFQ